MRKDGSPSGSSPVTVGSGGIAGGDEHVVPGPGPVPDRPAYLLLKAGEVLRPVRVRDVDWIEADGHFVRVSVSGEVLTVRQRLIAFEKVLDPLQFPRIHRSTIVNMERVLELRHWFGGDYQVMLKDGTELRLSRGFRPRLAAFTLPGSTAL